MAIAGKYMTLMDILKYREDFYTTDTYGINAQTGNYEAYQTGKYSCWLL